MFKTFFYTLAVLCITFSNTVFAVDCRLEDMGGDQKMSIPDVVTAFANKTLCVRGASDWEAQEYHNYSTLPISGQIVEEYAHGSDSTIDPTHNVATWSASPTDDGAAITYNYEGTIYVFTVINNSGYHFCRNGSVAAVVTTVVNGNSGCGTF